ncbi:MAG: helix-turn-helix transcriptional regulator [Alphaproteobacteria bacterium GM202ARS2]|nr:helix-turn-helix transcriptional regulator [Alphaproteobacteria bacterium GM202ARS2]
MKHLAGQWKTMLIFRLLERPRRFSELKQIMPGIADQVLSRQLTALVDADVIEKKKPIGGGHATYHLTAFGERLRPALAVIFEWGATALTNQAIAEKQRAQSGADAMSAEGWPTSRTKNGRPGAE